MPLPHIAIIILHYKNLADTRECLKSLQKLDYPIAHTPAPLQRRGLGGGSGGFSVIVVNNDILEHKTALEHEYGDFIKIIQNSQNLGFCEGNNTGIRYALADPKTDAILLLNNDTVVEKDFLKEMAAIDADMTAPHMMQYHHQDKIDNLGIVLMSSGLPFNRTNENQKLFCPSGGCALYTRKLLEAVAKNYFDPAYFAYCEDLDLGWRARNLGFEAKYAKDAIVYHKGSAIHGKLSDFAVYHTYRNLLWTQFKNMPWTLLLWQSPWLFLGWISLFAYYITKGKGGLIAKACIDGLRGLRFMCEKRKSIQQTKSAPNKIILLLFETGLFSKNLL